MHRTFHIRLSIRRVVSLPGYNMTAQDREGLNNSVLTYHRIVEAFKFAYAYRALLGDQDFANVTEVLSVLLKCSKLLFQMFTIAFLCLILLEEFIRSLKMQQRMSGILRSEFFGPEFWGQLQMSPKGYQLRIKRKWSSLDIPRYQVSHGLLLVDCEIGYGNNANEHEWKGSHPYQMAPDSWVQHWVGLKLGCESFD